MNSPRPTLLVEGQANQDDKTRFITLLKAALPPELPVPTLQLLVAQAALESSWGATHHDAGFQRPTAAAVYNVFNLSAGTLEKPSSAWKGPVLLGPDTEVVNGVRRPITQRWRAFPGYREACAEMLSPAFIHSQSWHPAYRVARAQLELGSLAGYLKALSGVYFTEPLARYQAGVETDLAVVRLFWPKEG